MDSQRPTATAPVGRGRRDGTRPLPWPAVAIVAVSVAGLALRLAHFGESLAEDEFLTYGEVHGAGFLDVIENVRGGVEQHPPLFFVLAWASEAVGGSGELIRLPSLIGGAATIPLVYLLGARTVGPPAGLIAAALVALSPFAIFQSVEARPYGLLAFFAALSTLGLLLALDRRGPGWWTLYALSSIGLLYTHNFGLFVLAAQALWALYVHRDRTRELLIVHGLVALAYAPWVPAFLNRGVETPAFLKFFKPLSVVGVRRELLSFFPGHPSFAWGELPGRAATTALVAIVAAAALLAAFILAQRLRAGEAWRPSPRLVLVVLLALATPLGFLAYSLSGPHTMTARYLTASMPAAMVALGALFAALPRVPSLAAVAGVVAVLAAGDVRSFKDDFVRPDYEAAARFVEERSDRHDAVVFADFSLGASGDVVLFGGRALSLEVYLNDRDILPVFTSADATPAFARASRAPRIFVVGAEPQPRPPGGLGARQVGRRSFPGSLPLAVTTYVPRRASFGRPDPARAPATEDAGVVPVLTCLERRRLDARRAQGSPADSTALTVSLPDDGELTLYIYDSEARARTAVSEIRAFVEAGAGGGATRVGRVVLGYLDPPPPEALALVESCAGPRVTGPTPAG